MIVLANVAQVIFIVSQRYLWAVFTTILAGAVLSVFFDFTLAYSMDHYDRSFLAVIERAAGSAILSFFVAYFALQNLRKRSK